MENTHTHKIMTFNGEEGMFPMYHVKFTAVVCGMGSKYFNALNGIAPYDTCTYDPIQAGRTPMRSVTFASTPLRTNNPSGSGESTSDEKRAAEQAAVQASSEEINQDYHDISRKVYSLLMTSLGMEPIKRLMNAGMVPGNGIGAWNLLCQEYRSNSSVKKRSLFTKLVSIKMDGALSKLADYTYEFRRIKSTSFSNLISA